MKKYDALIIGAGFAGAVTALVKVGKHWQLPSAKKESKQLLLKNLR